MKTMQDEARDFAALLAKEKYFRLGHRKQDDGSVLASICGVHFRFASYADLYLFCAKIFEVASLHLEAEKVAP